MVQKIGIYSFWNEALVERAKEVKKEPQKVVNREEEGQSSTIEIVKNEKSISTLLGYKALWVLDEKNNLLLRIVDEDGNVIKEIPPEEIIKLREKLNEIAKNVFKIEG